MKRKRWVYRKGRWMVADAPFTASVWLEGEWFVVQCLEIDVASQGKSEVEALANLHEALELYFEPPVATIAPEMLQ